METNTYVELLVNLVQALALAEARRRAEMRFGAAAQFVRDWGTISGGMDWLRNKQDELFAGAPQADFERMITLYLQAAGLWEQYDEIEA